MAISFVAAGAVVTGINPTVAVPAGYQQGDLLVIVVASNNTPTTPSGWSLVGSVNLSTPRLTYYRKFATGSESSVAMSVTGGSPRAVMVAYRGVSATDTVSTGVLASSTSITTNTLTTTYANEYVVSIYVSNATGATQTWTAPASTTARVSQGGNASGTGILIVDELQAAAGTSTARTATNTVSNIMSASSFSIIPSGRYWVGGAGTWTTTTTNWSFSSGGASGAPAPTSQDNVAFDQAGTYTVTMTGALTCLDITVSAGTVTFSSTGTLAISGSMTLLAGTVWSATGANTFNSTSTGRTITTNGVSISGPITFNGVGGGWTLGSAITTASTITFTNGTLDLNGQTLTLSAAATFLTATGTKNLTFNGGSLVIAASGATAFNNAAPTGFTTTAGTGTGVISLTSASAKTFVGGGSTFNCTLNQGGAGALTIVDSNTFSDITNTYSATGATSILFTAGTTSTFTNWSASGAATRLLTIGSVTAASHTLSKASGTVNANFLSISRSSATGGATWNAINSTDGGDNTGWIFTGGGNFLMFFM